MTITNSIISLAARSVRPAAVAAVLSAMVAAAGCSGTTRSGQGASYLIIDRLTMSGNNGGTFQSDVVGDEGVFEDVATVVLSAAMRDVTNPNAPTTNNHITVNRYRVSFRRSDGRNTPGVDVPYAFDGATTATICTCGATEVPFVIVRVQAKLESPLLRLRGAGGADVISTIAEVTFYGHDQTGREAQVTGLVSVNFADWAG